MSNLKVVTDAAGVARNLKFVTDVSGVIRYIPPKKQSLGETIDILTAVNDARRDAEAKLNEIKADEDAIRNHLITTVPKADLKGAKGAHASIAVVETTVPVLENWDEFFKFAKRKGNEDLLQRSVSSPAWRERVADKRPVPGVGTFIRVALKLTRNKKGGRDDD